MLMLDQLFSAIGTPDTFLRDKLNNTNGIALRALYSDVRFGVKFLLTPKFFSVARSALSVVDLT